MNFNYEPKLRIGAGLVALLVLSGVSTQALAQITHADDVNITGHLCAGSAGCTGTPFQDITISDTNAALLFEDTTPGHGEYQFGVDFDDFQLFYQEDGGGLVHVVTIEDGGNVNSLHIDSNGRIGMGHNSPLVDLHIVNPVPEIRLEDSDNGAFMDLEFSTSQFNIEGLIGQNVVGVDGNAPSGSLDITAEGFVGVGTTGADVPLHVYRTDGSAQLLVQDTNGTAVPRTLFRIASGGSNAKFEIDNTSAGVLWAFTNAGTDFRISRQGSGDVELSVDNAGNATLAGTLTQNSDRNAKQAIIPVDSQVILEKVIALPISQWQYRDSAGVNHVGPMAQDFYAAFALGGSNKGISSIDTGGVALAAIQALAEENDTLAGVNDQLIAENAVLRSRLEAIEQRQASMELAMTRLLENTAGTMLHTGGVKN